MLDFPKTIKFNTDGNELELERTVTENKILLGVYIYTKSITKMGKELKISKENIIKLKNSKTI